MSAALDPAVVAAWQGALAAEHQAVFAYGLLGPRLRGAPGGQLGFAVTCSDAHEAIRDAEEQAMASLAIRPVPPAVDYPALYPVGDAAAAARLAARVEQDCAAAWRALFAAAAAHAEPVATARRDDAQRRLTAAAVRAMQWRRYVTPAAATVAFPGITAG